MATAYGFRVKQTTTEDTCYNYDWANDLCDITSEQCYNDDGSSRTINTARCVDDTIYYSFCERSNTVNMDEGSCRNIECEGNGCNLCMEDYNSTLSEDTFNSTSYSKNECQNADGSLFCKSDSLFDILFLPLLLTSMI
jgi:hypothetical protein